MRVVMFYHSLLSDWNHGNAHFLRGIVRELKRSGHDVHVWEPAESWSLKNLVEDHGEGPVRDFSDAYPGLTSTLYTSRKLGLRRGSRQARLSFWSTNGTIHRW